jgi:PrcB C-terminal
MNARNLASVMVSVCMLALSACSTQVPSQGDDVQAASAALTQDFKFTEFVDPLGIGIAGDLPTRLYISTRAQYQLVFGHDAPADIKFGLGDRVVFYSAGIRPTGGYVASITRVRRVDGELRVRTHLDIPGASCLVTQGLTKPHVLVKFRLAWKPTTVRFIREREIHECEEPPSCADLTCVEGQHCEMLEIECITTPCNDIPVCVNDAPAVPTCGGIAGIDCPGLGTCLDNPFDSCDPNNGGADCGGLCSCLTTKICPLGSVWNPAVDVCACVLP